MSYIVHSKEIKVSIIIPVYNMEKYIRQCLQSVVSQTLQEIEAICIDDASTDASLSIILEYADMDPRIQIITYNTNKSASQARKDGALQAKGEYVMFLDGDDYLAENACQDLYHAVKSRGVEMLQFGTNVVNAGHASEERIANLKKILLPYYGRLEGQEVFKGCFIDKKYRFTIWNKIYQCELCKKAFLHVKDGSYQKAQDLYAFFILCFYAKSYYGIEETYYNYCFGAGITGNDEISMPQMERYCQSAYTAQAVSEFAAEQDVQCLKDAADMIYKDLLNECVSSWFAYLAPQDAAKGFDMLCQYWERKEIVSHLCGKYYSQ